MHNTTPHIEIQQVEATKKYDFQWQNQTSTAYSQSLFLSSAFSFTPSFQTTQISMRMDVQCPICLGIIKQTTQI